MIFLGGKGWKKLPADKLVEIGEKVEEEASTILVERIGMAKPNFRRWMTTLRKAVMLGMKPTMTTGKSLKDCADVLAKAQAMKGDLAENIKKVNTEFNRRKEERIVTNAINKGLAGNAIVLRKPNDGEQTKDYAQYVFNQLDKLFADKAVSKIVRRCQRLKTLEAVVAANAAHQEAKLGVA